MQMEKKLMLPGGILWIAGLILAIAGMNVSGDAGKWLQIIGNGAFLIGLAVVGIAWFRKKSGDEGENDGTGEKNPEKREPGA